jgi:hypothetical protein
VSGTGEPDVAAIPASSPRIREATPADTGTFDDIDRVVRGAPHGPDHELLGTLMQSFIVDDVDGRGYVWVRNDGEIVMVAGTDEDTATALLWRGLAHCRELGRPARVDHLCAEQQWAIRVAYDARLKVVPDGPVFWRGRTPPPAYLPSGAYL